MAVGETIVFMEMSGNGDFEIRYGNPHLTAPVRTFSAYWQVTAEVGKQSRTTLLDILERYIVLNSRSNTPYSVKKCHILLYIAFKNV